jgi:DNA-binding Lrp family transcriptional regulator
VEKTSGHAFISYVREDSLQVDQLQGALEAAGISVWRDTADLWPGEDWRRKIRRAITDNALVFIACFSSRSAARAKSYQYEELNLAIDQLRLRPPDVPWLIPVRFDDCTVPDLDIGGGRTMASIQTADLFGSRRDKEISRLMAVVRQLLGRHPAGQSAVSALVFITAPANKTSGIIRILMDEHWGLVTEAAAVYGEADVIARIETSSVQRLHEFVTQTIQNLPNVRWARDFIVVGQPSGGPPVRKGAVSAFVFIAAPANHASDTARVLVDEYRESVTEAAVAYGGADIIARIEASSMEGLHKFVMEEIRNLPGVQVTRTFLIIPQLHEFRRR